MCDQIGVCLMAWNFYPVGHIINVLFQCKLDTLSSSACLSKEDAASDLIKPVSLEVK